MDNAVDAGTFVLNTGSADYIVIENGGTYYWKNGDAYVRYYNTDGSPWAAPLASHGCSTVETGPQPMSTPETIGAVATLSVAIFYAIILVASRIDKIIGAWRRAEVKLPAVPYVVRATLGTTAFTMTCMVVAKFLAHFGGALARASDADLNRFLLVAVNFAGFIGLFSSLMYLFIRSLPRL